MDKCKYLTATVLVAAFSIPTITHAALVGRLAATEGGTDFQAYYDTEANRTWLADANYAMTSGYDADGRMTWQQSMDWAADLTVGGADGWRLASSDTTCMDYNCTGSEMGNLFYNVLGGSAGSSIVSTHNANYDLFSNVISAQYWSSTSYATNPGYAWGFLMARGSPFNYKDKRDEAFAWAVQGGDVGEPVSSVPVPAAVWLFGSGLISLVGFSRHKKLNN